MEFIKNKIMKNHYFLLYMCVFVFFSFLSFQGIFIAFWADAEIYLNIAQVIFDGGAIYKDATDTKNIGFLLFYYFLYFPYASVFDTMEYFYIWHAFWLTSMYLGIVTMAYNVISKSVNNKMISLLTTVAILLLIFGNRHSLFINQPQLAIFFCLMFLFYLSQTFERQTFFNYFIYGILLAMTFINNHTYAPIVLIIPFLTLQYYHNNRSTESPLTIFYKWCLAGVGFFTVIGMIAFYLYQMDALQDWLFWNWIYPHEYYLDKTLVNLFGFRIYIENKIAKMFFMLLSLTGIGQDFSWPREGAIVAHYLILIFMFIAVFSMFRKKIIQKNQLTSFQLSLFVFGMLAFLSRTLITRVMGSDSYNLYLIPLMIGAIPPILSIDKKYQLSFSKMVKFSFIYCLAHLPIMFFFPNKIEYNSFVKELVQLNPTKTPTVIVKSWLQPSYSTQWHNKFFTLKSVEQYDLLHKINEIKPEVVFSDSLENMDGYTRVSDMVLIRTEDLSSWILPSNNIEEF